MGSMENYIIAGISAGSALIGAFIGGGMPILGHFLQEWWQRRKRAEILSRAIAGELAAALEILERRKIVSGLREAAQATEKLPVFRWRVSKEYLPVIRGCVPELGILPGALPERIPRFLTTLNSAFEDFEEMRAGTWDDATGEQLQELYSELATLMEIVSSTASEIIKIINARYPSFAKNK